jgi:hypothetical protein
MKTSRTAKTKNREVPKWERQTIVAYLIATIPIVLLLTGSYNKTADKIILFYTVGTHLFLYFFKYKALRVTKTFMLWVGVGILHLFMYIIYRLSDAYMYSEHFNVEPLRNTLVVLCLYQILRYIARLSINKELVMPSRSGTDLYDDRKVTWVDFTCFVIYFFSTLFLDTVGTQF